MNTTPTQPETAAHTPELILDGIGINGPDKCRSRVATFVSSESVMRSEKAAKYGSLFAAFYERDRLREVNAEMVTMLRRVLDEYLIRDPSTGPVCALTLEQARAAIAKAEGGK